MKYLALPALLVVGSLYCLAWQNPVHGTTKIQFDSLTYSGLILNRKDGTWEKTVRFHNTGSVPLIITRAQTSGGPDMCEWPKEPIMPGKRGSLKYRLQTEGRGVYPSSFHKTVYVYSNASEHPDTLTFSGVINDNAVVPH